MASTDARVWLLLGVLSAGSALANEPLLGAGVGNADTLVSEGSKLFNRKQYPKAVEHFLKATRANPANLGTYLQLARASMLAKDIGRACYAYRVYLKAAPDSPDRKKAATEGDQCERQLKGLKKAPVDLSAKYVEVRATFFAALDKGELLGATGAAGHLATLVKDGFLGPELGEMGQKLGVAALAQANAVHQKALLNERVSGDSLKSARPLFDVAASVGASAADSRVSFLDGLAELQARDFKKAEAAFTDAAKADPKNREYQFYRALALYQAGERGQALKILDAELKDDPRTATLRAAQAVNQSPEAGAAELERLLFGTRYPPEK